MESSTRPPIAARIEAVPGWRVVTFQVVKERDDGLREISIGIHPVLHWALEAPVITPSSLSYDLQGAIGSLFGGNPFMPKSSPPLWPIDSETGERFENVHRLVPPCEDTNEQLIKAAQLWCAESIEKSKTPTP